MVSVLLLLLFYRRYSLMAVIGDVEKLLLKSVCSFSSGATVFAQDHSCNNSMNLQIYSQSCLLSIMISLTASSTWRL